MTKHLLKLAIQKSGRLSDDSLELLRECGIDLSYQRGSARLRSEAKNFPLEVLFLRDDDIPGYVADGVADLGIVGQNVVVESEAPVTEVRELGFSHCRLAIAVVRGSGITQLAELEGQRIATSYPKLLDCYLKEQGVQADIHRISGSVEIAPGIGLADAICDIVSSGSTLASNGLQEIETIFRSQAVLIAHPALVEGSEEAPKLQHLKKLQFRIEAVQRAKRSNYILLNAPNEALEEIIRLLPGIKSPTILPLAMKGWSSVHSVVHEDTFWEMIENLKSAGAEGILVIPVEKMIY